MNPHFQSACHSIRSSHRYALAAPGLRQSPSHQPADCGQAAARAAETPNQVLAIASNQCLTIVDDSGQPLFKISAGENGPAIQLMHENLRIDCPGKLDFSAQEICMTATQDVTVQGKTIRLN
jgi:hypothetical protein